ncbi:MAG: DoxX family membrane protein, partial [Prevotella sp.]|nr:DoxX family membrane protein [Prevotella sp.]
MKSVRLLLALTFIFSGFVKAVDPMGTQYKLEDYATAVGLAGVFPEWVLLGCSIALAATEFVLGVLLLFAISRRVVTKVVLAFMTVMTLLTVWIYIYDPVEDCGCFGDAIVLTNGETLVKNM